MGTSNGLYVLNFSGKIVDHFFLSDQNRSVSAVVAIVDDWWIAFNHTLVKVSPGTYGIELEDSIRLKSRINDLFVDNLNNIWIATNNSGLQKISCLREVFQHIDCKLDGPVFALNNGPNSDEVLASGDGFCSKIKLTDIKHKYGAELISEFPSIVWNACVDPVIENRFWFATQDGCEGNFRCKR